MSLLLDALKEAEARKSALPGSPPPDVTLDVVGTLALAEETTPPEAAPAERPARTADYFERPSVRPAVDEQPVRAIERSDQVSSPPRLRWLIGIAGAVLLVIGAVSVYLAVAGRADRARAAYAEQIAAATPLTPTPGEEPDTNDGSAVPPTLMPPARPADAAAVAPHASAGPATARSASVGGAAASSRAAPAVGATTAPPAADAVADSGGAQVRIERTADPLTTAFAALQAGDLERARDLYAEALAREPGQPDAELGLAVIAHLRGADAEALRRYRHVLESVPDHPRAWAGIAELAVGSDVAVAEARLRELLAQRRSASLHFALGNLLAREQRWADAQLEFFAAAALAPQLADYAVNLAIALDRLGKSTAAATYYQRALELVAAGSAARFDVRTVRERLEQLRGAP